MTTISARTAAGSRPHAATTSARSGGTALDFTLVLCSIPGFSRVKPGSFESCPPSTTGLFHPRETIVGNHRGAGPDHGEDHHRKAQRPIRLEPRRIAYDALGRRVSELRGALNGVSRLSLGKLEPGPRSHRQAISVGVTPTSEGIVQPGCATPFSSLIGLLQTVLNEKLAPSDIRC